MAKWDQVLSRGNVEDRRGFRPIAVVGGGLSLGTVALLLIVNYLAGGNVGDVLSHVANNSAVVQQQEDTSQYAGKDEYEVFASTVLGSTNDHWEAVFSQNNSTYQPPKIVLFREATNSACGGASSDVGPHYCPFDQTIYLDETFFQDLTERFGAQGGDVAQAYVIAHEVGHHVQQELGVLSQEKDNSVAVELQADCYAGLWANSIKDKGVFEPGEIQEAQDAAAAVGDDRVQKAFQGYVNPETWTHGSSQQRLKWFNVGYNSGTLTSCNTF
jgi:predicted metalloprotease